MKRVTERGVVCGCCRKDAKRKEGKKDTPDEYLKTKCREVYRREREDEKCNNKTIPQGKNGKVD